MAEYNKRLLQYSPTTRKWMIRAGGDEYVWPWPSLVTTQRRAQVYKRMQEDMMNSNPLGNFKRVLDIGQDRGESLMWISTIADSIIGLDVDRTMIDLSLVNYRMNGRYNPTKVHGLYVPPEKLIIDIDLPMFQDIDLVKIDAGKNTPFILEMLDELLERNRPTVFICHDDTFNNDTVWDWMLGRYDYHTSVVGTEFISSPHGVFVAYLSKELDDEKEEESGASRTKTTTQIGDGNK